jgi:hypothetical protein
MAARQAVLTVGLPFISNSWDISAGLVGGRLEAVMGMLKVALRRWASWYGLT